MADPIELHDFLKWTPPKLVPVISDGIMYAGSRVILFGRYKSLKSMLATQMCLAISRGDDWLGFKTTKLKVLYLQLEVPPPQLHNRITKMTHNNNGIENQNFWLWYEPSLKLDTHNGITKLTHRLEEIRPDVLVIDPVYKVVTDTNNVTVFIDQIDELKEQFGLSILMVHHPRKRSNDPKKGEKEFGDADDMLGSSIFLDWADSVIRVERESHTEIKVSFDVARHAENELQPRHFEFDVNTLGFTQSSGRKI